MSRAFGDFDAKSAGQLGAPARKAYGRNYRGERPAGRAELLANGPYWAGPPLSASRCRPRADRLVFFLAAPAFWKNPENIWLNLAIFFFGRRRLKKRSEKAKFCKIRFF